jgi:hypothetical protein
MSLYIVFHKWYNIVKFDRNNIYSEFECDNNIYGNEDVYIGSFIEQIISNNIDHMTRTGDIYAHICGFSSELDYMSNHNITARMTDKKFINLKKYIININNQKKLYIYKVKDLIKNIINFFKISNSCVILLFIYLWRLKNIYLNTKNWKNMIIAIMMVVVKWNEDWNNNCNDNDHLSNSTWAKFGNMTIYELNYLELLFCKDIKWKLFVTKNQFEMAKILIHMKYFEKIH